MTIEEGRELFYASRRRAPVVLDAKTLKRSGVARGAAMWHAVHNGDTAAREALDLLGEEGFDADPAA